MTPRGWINQKAYGTKFIFKVHSDNCWKIILDSNWLASFMYVKAGQLYS